MEAEKQAKDRRLCHVCQQPAHSRCKSCKIVYYCSRSHQIKDWSLHKHHCRKQIKNNAKQEEQAAAKEPQETKKTFINELLKQNVLETMPVFDLKPLTPLANNPDNPVHCEWNVFSVAARSMVEEGKQCETGQGLLKLGILQNPSPLGYIEGVRVFIPLTSIAS